MPWFKVDDRLYSHPKWLATSMTARGLWVTAGSWCGDHLTDGLVPTHVLPTLGGRPRDAQELVDNGLWVTEAGGWRFHEWLLLQPSRESVLAKREADRQRQQRARERAKESHDVSRRDTERTSARRNGPPDPTRPRTPQSPPSEPRGAIPDVRDLALVVPDDAVAPMPAHLRRNGTHS